MKINFKLFLFLHYFTELKCTSFYVNFSNMKVGLVQFNPFLGNVKKNIELHLKYIEKAKEKNLELLIFPELSLTGYTLKDLVAEVAIRPEKDPYFDQFKTITKNIRCFI